jgi:hypothetical protein
LAQGSPPLDAVLPAMPPALLLVVALLLLAGLPPALLLATVSAMSISGKLQLTATTAAEP